MINTFCKMPLWECNDTLVRVAQGQQPADVVIRHANFVSVATREVLPDTDIAISCGRIAFLGIRHHTAEHCIGPDTLVIDATGLYAAPGLMDSHIHVESAMVGVSEYARVVVPHGTTGIFADPHEVANVRGLAGARCMFDDKNSPLKAMMTPPSCVPAVRGVEDTGASIGAADIAEAMRWDDVVGLGEMMNFPGIFAADENLLGEIRETLKADRVVTGHLPLGNHSKQLSAYVAAGVTSDHECDTWKDVETELRMGAYVQLRYGSAWLSLPGYLKQLVESGMDTSHCLLCTDDCHPNTLLGEGHMNRVLQKSVELGLDPVVALQMCTVNCAQYFGLGREMGSATPGQCADIVLFEDLRDFRARMVLIDGEVVAENGEPTFDPAPYDWPDWMTDTMNLGFVPTAETFEIPAVANPALGVCVPNGMTCAEALAASAAGGASVMPDGEACVRAIGIFGGETITRDLLVSVPVVGGQLRASRERDILKACVFDRHHGTDGVHSFGFVTGFGIHGAHAQTVSHDAHNLLVIGDNDEDMALAARTLVECGGGEVSVADGKVLALLELPVCGLMSRGHAHDVAAEVAAAEDAWRQMGCTMPSPFMTMGLMSLACIPVLRLTNRGYVNCETFETEPLIAQ
jgi:adenine deaminase